MQTATLFCGAYNRGFLGFLKLLLNIAPGDIAPGDIAGACA
jgi:hypothetical protein